MEGNHTPAKARSAATPLVAAVPKLLFPFLVILPGIIALALTTHPNAGAAPLLTMKGDGTYDYNMALPLMLARYYPSGLLGLGLTALMASFMSGMAGNVTAFNTVWTYDIYQWCHRRCEPGDASEGRHGTSGSRLRIDAANLER